MSGADARVSRCSAETGAEEPRTGATGREGRVQRVSAALQVNEPGIQGLKQASVWMEVDSTRWVQTLLRVVLLH